MSQDADTRHLKKIRALTGEIDKLKFRADKGNTTVGGEYISSNVVTVHSLIKEHELIYSLEETLSGKWTWSGLCEIRRKGAEINPSFALPDGVATFFGNLGYDYNVCVEGEDTVIDHNVVSMSGILLDAKSRPAPRNSQSGVYGVDWWNVYMTIKLLSKLSQDIKSDSVDITLVFSMVEEYGAYYA